MATATATKQTATAAEWPYRFDVLLLDRLFVDDAYQRPLTNFVERIKRNFDPALVGTLVVSDRGKRGYAIIDGQTRWAAMRDLEFTEGPCVVFQDLDQGQEARLFARLQKERRGILSYHRFRAALVAGEQEAVDIDELVRSTGYKIGPSSKDAIAAVAALENAYRRGPEILARALLIYREGWGDRWMPAGEHIRGMSWLLRRTPDIDDERMARRLKIVSPEELKRRASALREGSGGSGTDRFMGQALEGVYRKR